MGTKATVISCVNQKGGTGKSVTTENLGIGLPERESCIMRKGSI